MCSQSRQIPIFRKIINDVKYSLGEQERVGAEIITPWLLMKLKYESNLVRAEINNNSTVTSSRTQVLKRIENRALWKLFLLLFVHRICFYIKKEKRETNKKSSGGTTNLRPPQNIMLDPKKKTILYKEKTLILHKKTTYHILYYIQNIYIGI